LTALGYKQQSAGDHEGAAALYREAVGVDERNSAAWFNLGITCQRLDRGEEAIHAYEKAAGLEPNNDAFRAALEAARRRRK